MSEQTLDKLEELREENERLHVRLAEQARAFCKANEEANKKASRAQQKLDLSAKAVEEAETSLLQLLAGTGEDGIEHPLRVKVIRALERIQRVRRTMR